MSVKLYSSKMCPWSHRVRIVVAEKNISLEVKEIPVTKEGTPEWFRSINPRKTVPTLQVGDRFVYEGSIIAEYLDETHPPVSSLIPGEPKTKYKVRFFCDEVNRVGPDLYAVMFGETDQKIAQEKVNELMARLEKLFVATSSAGPFFLGHIFSLADISLVPFLDRFSAMLKASYNASLFEQAPRLEAMWEAAQLRPSVATTMEPPDFHVQILAAFVDRPILPPPVFRLYANRRCVFSQRVCITAVLLDISLEYIEIEDQSAPEYRKINPRGTTPTLEVSPGEFLYESMLIIEYLCEKKWSAEEWKLSEEEKMKRGGAPPLYAKSSLERSNSRLFVDQIDEVLDAFVTYRVAKVKTGNRNNETVGVLLSKIHVLEGMLAQPPHKGPFFLGSEISIADVAIIPILFHALAGLQHYHGIDCNEDFPRLSGMYAVALQNRSIAKILNRNRSDPTPPPEGARPPEQAAL